MEFCLNALNYYDMPKKYFSFDIVQNIAKLTYTYMYACVCKGERKEL